MGMYICKKASGESPRSIFERKGCEHHLLLIVLESVKEQFWPCLIEQRIGSDRDDRGSCHPIAVEMPPTVDALLEAQNVGRWHPAGCSLAPMGLDNSDRNADFSFLYFS